MIAKLGTSNTGFNAWLEREKKLYDGEIQGGGTPATLPPNGIEASRKTLTALVDKVNELVEAVNTGRPF